MSKSVLPMVSSKSFIVSGLTFRSPIYFEFIFVYGVRECSNFIPLHVAVQFPKFFFFNYLKIIYIYGRVAKVVPRVPRYLFTLLLHLMLMFCVLILYLSKLRN